MATKQKSITVDDETQVILDRALNEFGVTASHLFRLLVKEYCDRGYKLSGGFTDRPIIDAGISEEEAAEVLRDLEENE